MRIRDPEFFRPEIRDGKIGSGIRDKLPEPATLHYCRQKLITYLDYYVGGYFD
jgi:hypothetical protein